MKNSLLAAFAILLAILSLPTQELAASDGDPYNSYWNCNGRQYGLIADGNRRSFYVPTGAAPIFFSGKKKGNSYEGTLYVNNQQIWVSGPISNGDKRITLRAGDGRYWVLDYSHTGG